MCQRFLVGWKTINGNLVIFYYNGLWGIGRGFSRVHLVHNALVQCDSESIQDKTLDTLAHRTLKGQGWNYHLKIVSFKQSLRGVESMIIE